MVYDNLFTGRKENLAQSLSQVAFVQGDIIDTRMLNSAFLDFSPEIVVHLAAIHFVPYCNENPSKTLKVNVVGTQNVLNCCLKTGVQGILFTSSAAVYPMVDRALSEDEPPGPKDIYGLSKLLGEMLLINFCSLHRMQCAITRLFNVYGPRDEFPSNS